MPLRVASVASLASLALTLSALACSGSEKEPPMAIAERAVSASLTPITPSPGPDRRTPEVPNPLAGDVQAANEGRRAFVQYNCYGCHGYHGGGGMGVSLRDEDWIYGGTSSQIYAVIARGGANGMPSWNGKLTDNQIWSLVTYIQTLAKKNEVDPPL